MCFGGTCDNSLNFASRTCLVCCDVDIFFLKERDVDILVEELM